jgi:tellurite resistance-related uncharacterized protein
MKKLPADVAAYKRTPEFLASTVPGGLLKDHNTKEGVWGLIKVKQGTVEYIIEEKEAYTLTPDFNGVIEPQVKHYVSPSADAVFYVEFYRKETII